MSFGTERENGRGITQNQFVIQIISFPSNIWRTTDWEIRPFNSAVSHVHIKQRYSGVFTV